MPDEAPPELGREQLLVRHKLLEAIADRRLREWYETDAGLSFLDAKYQMREIEKKLASAATAPAPDPPK